MEKDMGPLDGTSSALGAHEGGLAERSNDVRARGDDGGRLWVDSGALG